ncbi:MAG: carbamoyltransferase [Blastocatellia bacterium]|jgi:carbamoyltransferase|nr:carbamoyltransferase [Blastocatellia bacterium]
MNLFLGTNFGHGAAVAVMSEQGKVLFAVEEGPLVNEKESSRFPLNALSLITQAVDGRLDAWAEGWNPRGRLIHKGLMATMRYGLRDPTYFRHRFFKEIKRYLRGLRHFPMNSKPVGHVRYVGHHLAHAYSLLPAGLPANSLVLVSDTTAEQNSISSYYFSGREMRHIVSSPFPHSIGGVFHQLSYHLGFRGRTGPGKLMALSAFGEPRYLGLFHELSTVRDGVFHIDLAKFPAWRRDGSWLSYAKSAPADLGSCIRSARNRPDRGVDLAASAQAWLMETTWECIRQALLKAQRDPAIRISHLGLAGGVALNCQANGEIALRIGQLGLGSLTVSPWSDDSGTAIGAASWAIAQRGLIDRISSSPPFLGPPLTEDGRVAEDSDVRTAVGWLIKGHVIALASGRLEFGPRALGGRCLLGDPRRDDLRQKLNNMKSRPGFMPCAPVALEEDYPAYFKGHGSRHMAWTVQATQLAINEIPAAVHRSGHSRVQVLRRGDSLLLERVLHEFKRETGCGVLLLTSLNAANEPMPFDFENAARIARTLRTRGILSDFGWEAFS